MALSKEEIKAIVAEQAKYNALAAENADEQRSIRDVILDQAKQLKFQQTLKKDILGATNQIYNLEYDLRVEYEKALGTQESQLSIQKDIDKTLKSKRSLEQDIIALNKEGSELSIALVESLQEQTKEADKVLNILQKQADTSSEIRSNFGVAGFQGLSEIFGKLGGKASQLSKPFEAAANASRQVVQEGVEGNNKIKERGDILERIKNGELKASKKNLEGIEIFGKKGKKIYGDAAKQALKSGTANVKNLGAPISKFKLGMKGLSAGFGALGPIIKKALGPIGLIMMAVDAIKAIVGAMFAASEETAALQRNLYASKEEALGIRDRLGGMQERLNGVLVLSSMVKEEFNAINNSLGVAIDFTQELGKEFGKQLLQGSAQLRDNMGLSGEAISELQKESISTGESIENIYTSMAGVAAETSLSEGFMFNVNKQMEKAVKIQGALRLNFKNSNVELTRAVTAAERLGFNLEDINGSANKLLDFESSINAEMNAELLTGRDLNLEKARSFALSGDTLGVARELNNQGVTYNDLEKMNVLQRQAYAEAVGMSLDGLADSLKKQEEFNAIQKRAELAGVRIANIESKSLAEVYESLKETGRSEEDITKILGERIKESALAESAGKKFSKSMELVKQKFASMVTPEMVDSLADGATKFATFVGKFVDSVNNKGLLRTMVFGMGDGKPDTAAQRAVDRAKQGKAEAFPTGPKFAEGGIVTKRINNATVGEAGPEAIIPLSKASQYGLGDNQEVIVLLKEILAVAKSGGDVYLDSNKVGTALSLSNYKMQ